METSGSVGKSRSRGREASGSVGKSGGLRRETRGLGWGPGGLGWGLHRLWLWGFPLCSLCGNMNVVVVSAGLV